ncbi:MAG: hypothetical protein ACRCYU_01340 [Nocardioides sp.]
MTPTIRDHLDGQRFERRRLEAAVFGITGPPRPSGVRPLVLGALVSGALITGAVLWQRLG